MSQHDFSQNFVSTILWMLSKLAPAAVQITMRARHASVKVQTSIGSRPVQKPIVSHMMEWRWKFYILFYDGRHTLGSAPYDALADGPTNGLTLFGPTFEEVNEVGLHPCLLGNNIGVSHQPGLHMPESCQVGGQNAKNARFLTSRDNAF